MKIGMRSTSSLWVHMNLQLEMPIMCTLCLTEKKHEMNLSVSMIQAFSCSYFPATIMNSSKLGMTACQARKAAEW